MSWFSKPAAIVDAETDEDRLTIVEQEYRQAERGLTEARNIVRAYEQTHAVQSPVFVRNGKMFAAMNGRHNSMDTVLRDKEEHARQNFTAKLRAFTEMKIRMGLVK